MTFCVRRDSGLARCEKHGLAITSSDTTYYLGRQTLLASGKAPVARWRKFLFVDPGLPAAHFERIADLYRIALKRQPRAPLKAMRELLAKDKGGYVPSDSTIHGWIRQARQRGLLGQAIAGKAGEKPKEKSK